MKRLRPAVTLACLVAAPIAAAGEGLTAKAGGAVDQPTAAQLQPLQGTWEGFDAGDPARQKITITVTGNALRFHRDTNFWFATTFTLPAGAEPKQLRATIKSCPPSQADSIGKVVGAIFKIEAGTWTLATGGDGADGTPKSFEASENAGLTRYELRKVEPPKTK